MGEFERIEQWFARPAHLQRQRFGEHVSLLGIGDDCALLSNTDYIGQTLAVSSDMLVCGRHFAAETDPHAIGHKALAVNLSDLAAMGAQAHAFTLSLALDRAQDETWLAGFSQGLFALANTYRCELIGGDTTSGPLCISITVIGLVPPTLALRRDAAKPGDKVWVSGQLGAAAYALKYPGHSPDADERLHRPEPRLELGMALRGLSECAMDLSDGLLGDIVHILDQSKVGVALFADQMPWHPALAACEPHERFSLALQGGDDYELLFTAKPQQTRNIQAIGEKLGIPLSCIGEIKADGQRQLLDAAGSPIEIAFRGFDHFNP
ncbi:MAG: thiamine-phosphate kinase [Betaproteobacteria bacterium]|jgi:thiamine-monophosphate kinase|nr:thiamine-phosphate kinase [Pseudomonadota bacterium]NBO03383.1 thiamine-phosphate kinase [Betaproteobacteria bacterium]NBO95608.1 thiamine-phosphate kinase [Betaproteobacteria bacterium]NBP36113.1 thiamine-phosphate kinase [Betaproteobacteria bacterium]NBP38779.1 thiamine-phosphate kinase [Betaproteobacteria bacterium]